MVAMITSKEFWNKRSEIYDAQVGPHYEEAYRKTVEYTKKYLKEEDVVLDFACGTGIVTTQIASCVQKIRAIDIADEMVQITKTKIEEQNLLNIEVSQTDLFDDCLKPGTYDVVTAYNVLLYVENFDEVMNRIKSLLKPGGIFISASDCLGETITKEGIQKFIKSHTGAMPYVAFYSQKKLRQKISDAGFEVLESENLFTTPPNLFVAAKMK